MDISDTKRADGWLQIAHLELEKQVEERTEELTRANEQLQAEIAERRRVELALRDANQTLSALVEASPLAIIVMDRDRRITKFSKSAERMFGWVEQEVIGLPNPIIPPRKREEFDALQARVWQGEVLTDFETRRQRKDGSLLDVSISTTLLQDGDNNEISGVMALIADISNRKQAEADDLRQHQTQAVLGEMLRVSLLNISLEKQLETILDQVLSIHWLALESRGCIFLIEDDPEVLAMKAQRGLSEPLVNLCERVALGRCLCGRAALSGDIVFADCIDDRHENRPEGLLPHGHYCVPILSAGGIFGVITLYVKEGHRQDEQEQEFLRAVADILAGIIERKRAEVALRKAHDELEVRVQERTAELAVTNEELREAEENLTRSFGKLQRTLEGAIQAMALTVEMRDPYTAGHQRRVADLACAIAREMGLSEDQIAGTRMAAIIHDIGKIYVPAEILSKPGRLTEIEFKMIKTHAQIGYDILKTIEFPWPIAQIVFQHHERMDGSGYPSGLPGEDILLEARIMGVADVVEAMASHRPYRPALGIDSALAEIEAKRGALYDSTVVDACLRLFTEKGFELEKS